MTIRATGAWAAAIAAVALLTGLTGCAGSSTPPDATSGAVTTGAGTSGAATSGAATSGAGTSGAGTAGPATGAAALEGGTFVATEVTGSYSIAPGSTISLTFENGSLSARAGCNTMFGGYTTAGDVLTAPHLASTMMACDPALMAQDTWLAGFLGSSPTFTVADGTLTLTNGTDTMVMGPAPSGAEALEATGWKLVGLISQSGSTVTAVDPTLTAWIRFTGTDVAYNTSCNSGGGSAEVGKDTITFGALRTTLIFCAGPSGATELAMNAVLQGTTPYTIKDDPSGALLTIMSADGLTGLQFTADPTVGADAVTSSTAAPSSTG